MTKRKLIEQLRECAEDVDRKPIWMYRKKNSDAMGYAREGIWWPVYFPTYPQGTIILLLILADMLEAE